MKKFSNTEKTSMTAAISILVLFICVSVITVILFGMLKNTENQFSDYRKNAEIKFSNYEKDHNKNVKDFLELNNNLKLAEKNKHELEKYIAEIESKMKELENSFNNKDELYGELNSKLAEQKKLLQEKQTEIDSLRKDLSDLQKMYCIDLNSQIEILSKLEKLLKEGAPMNKTESVMLDSDGNSISGEDGLAQKNVTYSYPKISVYYEDLERGYKYVWNKDVTFKSESSLIAPFAYTVLSAAADEKAAYDEEISDIKTQNGPDAVLPPFNPVYDFNKIFVYTEDKYRPGSGVIKNEEFGVEYNYIDLLNKLLKYSDNIAFDELKNEYGVSLLNEFVRNCGIGIKNNTYEITSVGLGNIMKNIYWFIEGSEEYSEFMKDAMMSSIHTVMIGYGVSPKKIAHKYVWDDSEYHDMAIVYDEHPYVLVIMSDMGHGESEVNSYIQEVVSLIDSLRENFYMQANN